MNQSKRLFFQILLWTGIWTVLWVLDGAVNTFIYANISAFIFQIILFFWLIFYAAPKLLFQRKYIHFMVISLVAIGVFAFLSIQIGPNPPPMQGPPPGVGGGMRRPPGTPSRFFIHVLMIAISYILATFLETFVFAQRKEEETIRNKNENLQTELKLLKSQINPHFLFNSLNNIYALSVIDSEKTQQSISYLSNMLRYVLYECDRPMVPVEKEVAYIKNYLRLFALKSSKEYPITTNFIIGASNKIVAPMLLIPFIENALKHGNLENRTDAFLSIELISNEKQLVFKVENSIPQTNVQKDEVGGIGLDNVKKRLNILYPNQHKLTIKQKSLTFKVQLQIDLNAKD